MGLACDAVSTLAQRQAMLDVEVQHQDVAPGLVRLQRRRDRKRLRDDGMDLAAQAVALLHRFEHQRATEGVVGQGRAELDLPSCAQAGAARPSPTDASASQASTDRMKPPDQTGRSRPALAWTAVMAVMAAMAAISMESSLNAARLILGRPAASQWAAPRTPRDRSAGAADKIGA